jgi:hypothetical protein
MIVRGPFYQTRVMQSRGAEYDAVDAESQPMLDCATVANAAPQLYAQIHCLAYRRYRQGVARAASESAVEVDDMKPAEAGIGELPRLRRWVLVEDGCRCHVAANKAYAGAVLEVDRRE